MFHTSHSSRKSPYFFLTALILSICLAIATPVFATDPEEADPDPDGFSAGSQTRVIVLRDLSDLDPARLEPGRYIVRIIDADGTQAVYEIVIDG